MGVLLQFGGIFLILCVILYVAYGQEGLYGAVYEKQSSACNGSVVASLSVASVLVCSAQCSRLCTCKAFNVQTTLANGSQNVHCELLRTSQSVANSEYTTEATYEAEPAIAVEVMYEEEPVYAFGAMYEAEPVRAVETLYEEEPILAVDTMYEEEPVLAVETMYEAEPVLAVETMYEAEPILAVETMYEAEPVLAVETLYEVEPALAVEAMYEAEPVYVAEEVNEIWTNSVCYRERFVTVREVAASRPATQSSDGMVNDVPAVAARAVDGDTNSRPSQGSCARTRVDDRPWWAVDLEDDVRVTSVKIWNHLESYTHHLSDVNIYVSSDSEDPNIATNKVLCSAFCGELGMEEEISCETPVIGRYVIIEVPENSSRLTLCEVQVYTDVE